MKSSSDLQGFNGLPSPWLMLFPKDGGCLLYNPKEGKIEKSLGDFPGYRFLANSGNWCLVLDSGSNLSIIDVFSKKTITLPSLESTKPTTSVIKRVGDTNQFERIDIDCYFRNLSSDVVRGLLWVDENGQDYFVVWLFDLPGHAYISFCKRGDTHYTDVPLFHQGSHWLDGLSEMVLKENLLYVTTGRRYVRVLDLSGEQGTFKDITEGKPFPMLSRRDFSLDSSIAVTTSGEVLLIEGGQDPCNRTFFRVYKKNLDLEDPDDSCHPVLEVESLGGEALLLDLGFTVPANENTLIGGIEPDSIYFTRHYRPCQCKRRVLDICVYNLATKTLRRFPDLEAMNLMDARWFLPAGN